MKPVVVSYVLESMSGTEWSADLDAGAAAESVGHLQGSRRCAAAARDRRIAGDVNRRAPRIPVDVIAELVILTATADGSPGAAGAHRDVGRPSPRSPRRPGECQDAATRAEHGDVGQAGDGGGSGRHWISFGTLTFRCSAGGVDASGNRRCGGRPEVVA